MAKPTRLSESVFLLLEDWSMNLLGYAQAMFMKVFTCRRIGKMYDSLTEKKSLVEKQGSFSHMGCLRQGAGDGAEGVADLGPKQAYNYDHHDGNKRDDDRIFDEALPLFKGCK